MDIEALRLFIDVAEQGSFAAVARVRGADPSSISRPIAILEAELGVRLFQRTTRAMALTEVGERYLRQVRPLVEGLERAGDELDEGQTAGPVGMLRMTASVAFGQAVVAPLLPRFRESFAGLRVELVLDDGDLDLVAEKIDLAIRLGPSLRGDLIGVKLFETRYRVVVSPDYIARCGQVRDLDDLAQRSCLLFAMPELRKRWVFRRGEEVREIGVTGAIVSSNATVLKIAALDGLGPALLADWLVGEELRTGTLVECLPGYQATPTTFETAAWLLYPSRNHLSRKVRLAADFFRQSLT